MRDNLAVQLLHHLTACRPVDIGRLQFLVVLPYESPEPVRLYGNPAFAYHSIVWKEE